MDSSDWPENINTLRWTTGNFRTTPHQRISAAARAREKRARREGNCEKHLAALRMLWCVCGAPDARVERLQITVHHLKTGPAKPERGLGRRATDRWGLPMWWPRHEELENLGSKHEYAYFMDRGIDPYEWAYGFWCLRGMRVAVYQNFLNTRQFEAASKIALPR